MSDTETTATGTTGDHAVDEALRELDRLRGRPVKEHVAVLEAVHGALSDRLAEGHG